MLVRYAMHTSNLVELSSTRHLGGTPETRTFILVHGTFARGAPWTRPESKLYFTLKSEFPGADIRYCDWSGKNSHSERHQGSEKLREFIKSDEFTGRDLYIIAHSHGGNVALQAIAHDDTKQRVRGLVCMATPFIHVTARTLDTLFKPLSALAPAYAVIVALPILAALGVLLIDLVLGLFDMPSENYAFLFVIFWSFAIVGWLSKLFQITQERIQAANTTASHLQRELRARMAAGTVEVPVVAAYVSRDEAALTLGIFSLFGELPQRVWPLITFLLKLSAWVAGIGLIVGVILEVIFGLGVFQLLAIDLMLLLFGYVIPVSFGWVVLMAMLPYLVRGLIVFGGEGVFDNFILWISSSRMPPPSVKRPYALPIYLGLGLRVRHSAIYSEPRFLAKLPDVIRGICKDPTASELEAKGGARERRSRISFTPVIGFAIIAALVVTKGGYYMDHFAQTAGPADWKQRYPELRNRVIEERLILQGTSLPSDGITEAFVSLGPNCSLIGAISSDEDVFVDVHELELEKTVTRKGSELHGSFRSRRHSIDVPLAAGIYHLHVKPERKPVRIEARVTHVCWEKPPARKWTWREWFR